MFVRCEDCNYENLAQHSFCGMCGAKLPSPRRAAPLAVGAESGPVSEPRPAISEPRPAPIPQRTISGPSLLGLSGEPTERERVNYLLEDEPGSGSGRRWLAALVLAAAVGVAGWHWRTQIRGWAARSPQNAAENATSAPPTAAVPEAVPASATVSPPTATPPPAVEGNASNAPAAASVAPPEQAATPTTQAMTDAVARAPETKPESKEDTPSDLAANAATAPVASKLAKPKIERTAPAIDESAEALESQGENYLYGRGVQADCGRAGKSLLAAAAHSSLKAQSVLGTMYATGHCVTRDLPAAYRWFAKASHQDPGSVRLQRDLEVLWQQMTPEEREIATKAAP